MTVRFSNVAVLAAIALLEALQGVIVLAIIFSFIPIHLDDFLSQLFLLHQRGLRLEREMLFYRVLIIAAVALQVSFLAVFRKSLDDEEKAGAWKIWLGVLMLSLLPQAYAIIHIWLGVDPSLHRGMLYVSCVMAYGLKIFWPEVLPIARRIYRAGGGAWRNVLPSPAVMWNWGKDRVVVFILSASWCLQLFLFLFALSAWARQQPPWPAPNGQLYWCGAVIAATVSVALVLALIRRGKLAWVASRFAGLAVLEAVLTFFLLAALFKLHVFYYQPQLAQKVYQIMLILAVVCKVAWPWTRRFGASLYGLLADKDNSPALKLIAAIGTVVFIFLFLYVPDLEAAIARVFMGEQFHHVDACLMNTAWSYHAGSKLNIDVNNRYGIGIAVFTSALTGLYGAFSYLNVYSIVMFGCIIYFIAVFGLLRSWLNSVPLAMAGILISLKMLPFHEETASFYLTNPSTTVCRYFFDIPFLWVALLFLRTLKKVYFATAGLLCGVALFYVTDTGAHLTMAYYCFLIFMVLCRASRQWIYNGRFKILFVFSLFFLPLLTTGGLLRLTQGPGVFTSAFWNHMTEYAHLMIPYASIPIWEGLKMGDPWAFSLGLWCAAVYVFTLILIGSLWYVKKLGNEHLFVCLLCVYGLGLYHYYINRSSTTNFYPVILPYVFVLIYWVKSAVVRLSQSVRLRFYLVFLGICFYSLWTTHHTLAYPNAFNLSRNPAVDPLVAAKLSKGKLGYFNQLFIQYPAAFKMPVNSLGETFEHWRTEDDFKSDAQLKTYFREEFNFAQDAALMAGLSRPDEPVALISSFEIQMLIQANRRPFFYIFPLINSRPMRMRLFEVTHMWMTTQLASTIKQLETDKPKFVFMERIYLAPEMPQAYLYDMPGLFELINYVRARYEPYAQGKYLVAMKLRKI